MKNPILIFIVIILLFSGCSSNQNPSVKKLFQTNNATITHLNYKDNIQQLLKYQKKLNLRNPKKYNHKTDQIIYNQIKYSKNNFFLFGNKTKQMKHYQDYLNYAFNKNSVKNRSDYLILGIYRLLYDTYEMDKSHKFTSLSYDINKFKKAYKLMKIIQWKIKHDKDNNGNYLFKTWQNNWQLELEKKIKNKIKPSWELIKNLEYIKNKKETIFDSSNISFELLTNNIIQNIKTDIRVMGEEPSDLALDALSFFIFL
jgi:hypothetical protein